MQGTLFFALDHRRAVVGREGRRGGRDSGAALGLDADSDAQSGPSGAG